MEVKHAPETQQALTPYLFVRGASQALEFYRQAFGAHELLRMERGGGKIGHAEIQLGNSRLWLSDEAVENGYASPLSYGGTPVCMFLYVADVDAVFARALALGATEQRPVSDQFYGDRVGTLVDPFGHVWSIATRKEHLTPAELARRGAEWVQQNAGA